MKVLRRDDYRCVYCGAAADAADHVIPRSKGGPTTMANLVAACNACNGKKGDDPGDLAVTRGLYHLIQKGEDLAWIRDHLRT